MSREQLPLPDMPTPPPVQSPASATALLARLRRAEWNAAAFATPDGQVHRVSGRRSGQDVGTTWRRQAGTGAWKIDSCWTQRHGETARTVTLSALNTLIIDEKEAH